MTDEEFTDLKKDIQEHGFNPEHDIVIHEDLVLDGWHRLLACNELGLRPGYRHFIAPDMAASPIEFVLRENLHRRNLTGIQRAQIAEAAIEMMIDGDEPKIVTMTISSEAEKTEAVSKIADVSPSTVRRARRAKKAAAAPDETKAKEEKKNAAHGAAVRIIDGILGKDWCEKSKLAHRELVKLSGIESEEMKRIEPYLREGWKVDAALGHKAVNLTHGHTIRDLCNRAIEFGKFTMLIDDWEISVRKKKP